jgi:hypothetical protein
LAEVIEMRTLVARICDRIAQGDAALRRYVAAQVCAEYDSDECAIEAINEKLSHSVPEDVLAVANDCLDGRYELRPDGKVGAAERSAAPGAFLP